MSGIRAKPYRYFFTSDRLGELLITAVRLLVLHGVMTHRERDAIMNRIAKRSDL